MAAPDARLEEILTEQYFLELMKDVSDNSMVEKMAIHLKVPKATFAKLKKESATDTPLLATKVLMAWQNNLTCDTVMEAAQQQATALKNIGLARIGKQVLSLIDIEAETASKTTLIDIEVDTITSKLVEAPPPVKHHWHKKRCTAAICGWIICYSTLGILVLVSVAAIPSVKNIPRASNNIKPPFIMANDTAELSFSLSTHWLHTLSLSIDGECKGVAYTHHGKCSDLYSTARVCYQVSELNAQKINYLLPGSSLNISISAGFSCKTNIWIVWNPDLLYSKKKFSNASCDNPPPQTLCLQPQINQSEPTYLLFNVTEPAYYTHFYSPSPPLSCDLTRYYNICTYNVSKLAETASAVTQEPIQSDLVNVDLLYKSYTFGEVCTTFHVKDENYVCQTSDLGGKLHVEVSRRQDVLLFPSLLAGMSVLVVLIVIGVHIISCKIRRKRRAVVPGYQPVHNTNE